MKVWHEQLEGLASALVRGEVQGLSEIHAVPDGKLSLSGGMSFKGHYIEFTVKVPIELERELLKEGQPQ